MINSKYIYSHASYRKAMRRAVYARALPWVGSFVVVLVYAAFSVLA